ncbi:MAG: DUF885 domain-containing protein [Candidatus Bipolaricaulota bacterium]|nr:DUF885 domain-containing protein [Candidatus Bipolaricaulota bacterium]
MARRIVALCVWAFLIVAGIVASVPPTAHRGPANPSLVEYLNRVAVDLVRQSPEAITTRGLSQKLGVRNDALDSLVLDTTGASYDPIERALERIESSDLTKETERDRRAIEIFAWWLRDAVAARPFQRNACLVSTYMTSTPQHLVWFMTSIHPLKTRADAEDYLARLSQIPARFDELGARLLDSESIGALPPRFLLERAADEIEAIGGTPAKEATLYMTFADALRAMSDVEPSARETLLVEARRLLVEVVQPAFVELASSVRTTAARATDDAGIWKQSNGAAYYAYLLGAYTTTDLTADEIYDLGLKEVERIQAEIRTAAASAGFEPTLSLADLFAQLRATSGEVSGRELLAACRALIEDATTMARPDFAQWPRQSLVVEAGGSTAYFLEGAEDGSRPAVFYAPVDQVRPAYSLRSLVYHETIPGHFLQAATAQEANLPEFLGGIAFSAFSEGWALYAERLAWELGAYRNDPYGNLGRLQEELFRAARLVVDTGIHARRWTFEQAVNYMMETTGLAEDTVRDEVERYIAAPGQAVAYTVGLVKILELRDRARQALGPAFDLAQFHAAVLAYGSVPLPILEELVDEFVAERAAASSSLGYPSG